MWKNGPNMRDQVESFPSAADRSYATPDKLVEYAMRLIRITRTLVDSGRAVDLRGLEWNIGLACAKTLDLPPEQGKMLRPKLIELLGELDALKAAIAFSGQRARNGPGVQGNPSPQYLIRSCPAARTQVIVFENYFEFAG
jgi:hypothetical protein